MVGVSIPSIGIQSGNHEHLLDTARVWSRGASVARENFAPGALLACVHANSPAVPGVLLWHTHAEGETMDEQTTEEETAVPSSSASVEPSTAEPVGFFRKYEASLVGVAVAVVAVVGFGILVSVL